MVQKYYPSTVNEAIDIEDKVLVETSYGQVIRYQQLFRRDGNLIGVNKLQGENIELSINESEISVVKVWDQRKMSEKERDLAVILGIIGAVVLAILVYLYVDSGVPIN